jgi:hypothetical protein
MGKEKTLYPSTLGASYQTNCKSSIVICLPPHLQNGYEKEFP